MGGTFARLVEQGHEVHVAYETSGSIAVLDDYLYQQMDIACSFTKLSGGDLASMEKAFEQVKKDIESKKADEPESSDLLKYKAALRQCRSRGADQVFRCTEKGYIS